MSPEQAKEMSIDGLREQVTCITEDLCYTNDSFRARRLASDLSLIQDELERRRIASLEAAVSAMKKALEFIRHSMLERGYDPRSACMLEADRALAAAKGVQS